MRTEYVVTLDGELYEFKGKIKWLNPPQDWVLFTEDKDAAVKASAILTERKFKKLKYLS